MAKKSAIALKDEKINDMVAAGIEVKLTKMEIADYIAEKAKEELENRQNELDGLIRNYMQNGVVVNMTKKQKTAADALKAVIGKDVFVTALYRSNIGFQGWSGWFAYKNNEGEFYACSHFAQFDLEPSQIPDNDVEALIAEQRDNWNRMRDLGKKKHRTILVEQILSGSDSGKKVLADLNNMVQRAVHGDKAAQS